MHQLLSSVFSNVWFMEERAALSYLPIVVNLLKGNNTDLRALADKRAEYKQDARIKMEGVVSGNMGGNNQQKMYYQGGVLNIVGAITKYDQECGPVGLDTIQNQLIQNERDKDIDFHFINIDSGGGEASCTIQFANHLHQKVKKTKIGFVNSGVAASSAYYIAAACDVVIISQDTDIAGSIGTMMSFMDFKGYFEKEGIKIHEVYSSFSGDKNKDFQQALEGDYEAIKANILDPFAQKFISDVLKFRGDKINLKKEDVTTGKTYMGEKAIEVGLVDYIGDRDFAMQKAIELIEQKSNSNINSNTMAKGNMNFPILNKILGGVSEDEHNAKLQELENTLAQVQTLKAEKVDLEGKNKTLLVKQSDLEAQIVAKDKTITEQATKITSLEKQLDIEPENNGLSDDVQTETNLQDADAKKKSYMNTPWMKGAMEKAANYSTSSN